MLPAPGTLWTAISPPSSAVSSRLIDSPRPVPPKRRLVVPSACWNASKMTFCLFAGMPTPVSETMKAITSEAVASCARPGDQPLSAGAMRSCTEPRAVNLKAFDSRFLRTCCRRFSSVSIVTGSPGSMLTLKSSFCSSAVGRKVRST